MAGAISPSEALKHAVMLVSSKKGGATSLGGTLLGPALCSGLNLALKLDHPNPQKAQRQLGFLEPLGRVLRASREGQGG